MLHITVDNPVVESALLRLAGDLQKSPDALLVELFAKEAFGVPNFVYSEDRAGGSTPRKAGGAAGFQS
jgi:hypothetical protein